MIKEYSIEDEHTERDVEVLTSTIDELENMKKALDECMKANIKLLEENKRLEKHLKRAIGSYGYNECEPFEDEELDE